MQDAGGPILHRHRPAFSRDDGHLHVPSESLETDTLSVAALVQVCIKNVAALVQLVRVKFRPSFLFSV